MNIGEAVAVPRHRSVAQRRELSAKSQSEVDKATPTATSEAAQESANTRHAGQQTSNRLDIRV